MCNQLVLVRGDQVGRILTAFIIVILHLENAILLIVKRTVLLVLVYLFYTNHREYKPHRVTLFVYQFVTYKGGFTRRYWVVLAAKQKVTVRGQQRSCTVCSSTVPG